MNYNLKIIAISAAILLMILIGSACSKTEAAEVNPCETEIPTFEEALADQPESKDDYQAITEVDLIHSDDPFDKYYAISIDNTPSDISEEDAVDIAQWEIFYHTSDEELRSDDSKALTTELANVDRATVYGKTVHGGNFTIYVYVTDIEY